MSLPMVETQLGDDASRPAGRRRRGADSVPAGPTVSEGITQIGKGVVLQGEVKGGEDIVIDGQVDGTIRAAATCPDGGYNRQGSRRSCRRRRSWFSARWWEHPGERAWCVSTRPARSKVRSRLRGMVMVDGGAVAGLRGHVMPRLILSLAGKDCPFIWRAHFACRVASVIRVGAMRLERRARGEAREVSSQIVDTRQTRVAGHRVSFRQSPRRSGSWSCAPSRGTLRFAVKLVAVGAEQRGAGASRKRRLDGVER